MIRAIFKIQIKLNKMHNGKCWSGSVSQGNI